MDTNTTAAALNERQRKFTEFYAATGNASQSAVSAGYSAKTATTNAAKLLKNTQVQQHLQAIAESASENRVASALERQMFWTAVMRGTVLIKIKNRDGEETGDEISVDIAQRLKASELLGKAHQDFVERVEHTGKNGGPIAAVSAAVTPDDLAGMDAQALARLYFGKGR
ncbi:terminase small subunit (plasmid) [Deinococcus radiomollis]|uniref:terminase small subunit n=1 Tax=Deinococcus radiomollis TaxID=468916 RepID=UPI003891EAC4